MKIQKYYKKVSDLESINKFDIQELQKKDNKYFFKIEYTLEEKIETIKKNKSLCFLLIIATIYVLVTLLYINPLREKNTKLEEKRNEILTLRQEDNSIQVFSEKEKVAEDIILSIEKSIGNLVDINFINKQYEQGEQSEVVILELNFSSNSKKSI